MNNKLFPVVISMAFTILSACSKIDDYPAPSETLTGEVIDRTTGEPIQSESNGIRMRLEELSWNNGVGVIPQYFNVKYDGTFNNTKLFKGNYKIYPMDGPFVPVVTTSDPIIDSSQTMEISGVTHAEFNVAPFLKVEWVGAPVLNSDNTVTVQIRFTRGTPNPAYQFNVTDVYLFVSTTEFVSNASFDNRLSTQVNYSGTNGNALLGQTVTITSQALGSNRPYYVRVGARTADNVNKRYNYNAAKLITVP